MSPFRRFWSYLDGLQHRTAVKVVLTVIAAAVVVAVFGRTWWIANDARSRFNDVVEVLRQANSVSKEAAPRQHRNSMSGEMQTYALAPPPPSPPSPLPSPPPPPHAPATARSKREFTRDSCRPWPTQLPWLPAVC